MYEHLSPGKKAYITRLTNKGIAVPPSYLTSSTPPTSIPAKPSTWTLNKSDQKYSYNEEGDYYVTYLKSSPDPIKVDGDLHRQMHAAYSNWTGKEYTANELCTEFSFPIEWFSEYKDIYKWTHDQAPVTKEELFKKDTTVIVTEMLAKKKSEIKDQFYKRSEKDTKAAADKWMNYEASVLAYIEDVLRNHKPYAVPKLDIQEGDEAYALFVAPMDLHYGKGAWMDETGQSYSREECRELLMYHTSHLLSRATKLGRPDKIICAIGSDWFHIDNAIGATTGLTKQDLDGSPGLILKEGMELAVEHIDLLREVGPVELIMCAGNHDEHSSIALLMFLYAWYRDCSDVTVNISLKPRNYTTYGTTLIAASHGDSTSPQQIAKIIPHEARELWGGMQHTVLFTGHRHYEQSSEDSGIACYQIPSLSGADRYHSKKGYILSRRALTAYPIFMHDGPGGTFISPMTHANKFGFKVSGFQKKR